MSNKNPRGVRHRIDEETDARILRTRQALGWALVGLVQERDYDSITVQHILDRAGVARATFYAHYRDKNDVLHSLYDQLFSSFGALLERSARPGRRLFPVAEFIDHVASARGLLDALRRAGQLDPLWELFVGYAARIIEARLARSEERGGGQEARSERQLRARMLAGALVELIKWWDAHPDAATSTDLDARFHSLAAPRTVRSTASS